MNATAGTTMMQHALTFNAHEIKTIKREGQVWMSGNELGRALEYADPDTAVKKIYNRNSDEFTATMTKVVKVATAGGKQAVRFFSLRGAHLIAMFSRTPVAKAFRAWVLDILDREVGNLRMEAKSGYRISEDELGDLQGLCTHMEFLRSWFRRVYPGLHALNPRLAAAAHDHFADGVCFSRVVVKRHGLKGCQEYAAGYPWDGGFTERDQYRRSATRAGA